jgi:hypothetical protein
VYSSLHVPPQLLQAEAAQAVGLAPIATGRRSQSPEPRRSLGSGLGSLPPLPLPSRSNLSGGSGDDWWRT